MPIVVFIENISFSHFVHPFAETGHETYVNS